MYSDNQFCCMAMKNGNVVLAREYIVFWVKVVAVLWSYHFLLLFSRQILDLVERRDVALLAKVGVETVEEKEYKRPLDDLSLEDTVDRLPLSCVVKDTISEGSVESSSTLCEL